MHGVGEGVVDFEDGVFRDKTSGLGDFAGLVFDLSAADVFALNDGKSFHDVINGVARSGEPFEELKAVGPPLARLCQIEMEVRGIQLAPQQKPTLLIPSKRRPVMA